MKSLNTVFTVFGIVAGIVFVLKLIQGSESPVKLLFKAALSALVIWVYFDLKKSGPFGMLFSIAALSGLAVIWWADVGEMLGGAIAGGFTGGGKVDKTALLSRVESLRKTGRYEEALEEAQVQLAKFKNDFDCYMMIASIQAEDMGNLPIAQSLLESLIENNKKLERKQVSYALNSLADWQLKYGKDPEAAKVTLQKIIEKYPDTRASQSAESRIAHMASKESLEASDKPKEGKVMPKFERDLGLKGKKLQMEDLVQKVDPNEQTDQYLAHLEAHPNDWDTREKLAAHYIEHYQNVPCAVEELEILIKSKLAGKEDKCRWLHQIADWHTKIANDQESAKAALQRIVDKYPGSAHATRAEQAIQYLRESKA